MSKKINKKTKELVKARLNILPQNIRISIGESGSFDKEELIEHVEKEDRIGKKMVEIDMEFLKSLRTGEIYEQNTFDNQT